MRVKWVFIKCSEYSVTHSKCYIGGILVMVMSDPLLNLLYTQATESSYKNMSHLIMNEIKLLGSAPQCPTRSGSYLSNSSYAIYLLPYLALGFKFLLAFRTHQSSFFLICSILTPSPIWILLNLYMLA